MAQSFDDVWRTVLKYAAAIVLLLLAVSCFLVTGFLLIGAATYTIGVLPQAEGRVVLLLASLVSFAIHGGLWWSIRFAARRWLN